MSFQHPRLEEFRLLIGIDIPVLVALLARIPLCVNPLLAQVLVELGHQGKTLDDEGRALLAEHGLDSANADDAEAGRLYTQTRVSVKMPRHHTMEGREAGFRIMGATNKRLRKFFGDSLNDDLMFSLIHVTRSKHYDTIRQELDCDWSNEQMDRVSGCIRWAHATALGGLIPVDDSTRLSTRIALQVPKIKRNQQISPSEGMVEQDSKHVDGGRMMVRWFAAPFKSQMLDMGRGLITFDVGGIAPSPVHQRFRQEDVKITEAAFLSACTAMGVTSDEGATAVADAPYRWSRHHQTQETLGVRLMCSIVTDVAQRSQRAYGALSHTWTSVTNYLDPYARADSRHETAQRVCDINAFCQGHPLVTPAIFRAAFGSTPMGEISHALSGVVFAKARAMVVEGRGEEPVISYDDDGLDPGALLGDADHPDDWD